MAELARSIVGTKGVALGREVRTMQPKEFFRISSGVEQAERLFTKPTPMVVEMPPIPPPPALPQGADVEQARVRRKGRTRGREETFLTGELTPVEIGKKRKLA